MHILSSTSFFVTLVIASQPQTSSCQNLRLPGQGQFDIISSLNSIRSNILSLFGSTFSGQPRPSRPARPGTINRPPPPRPFINQPLPPQPLPPNPTSFSQGVFPSSNEFSASQPQPLPAFSENPIVEVVSNNFDNSVPTENLILSSPGGNNFFPESSSIGNNFFPESSSIGNSFFPESSSIASIQQPVPVNSEHSVPSFIDSERVNAGISEVSNEIDNGKFDIPHDLWREDTLSIQHQKKIRTVKESL